MGRLLMTLNRPSADLVAVQNSKNFALVTTADTVPLAAERTPMLGRGYSFRHWGAKLRGLWAERRSGSVRCA